LMMVLDKTKDIGILMSMGATRRSIARIFLRQGLTIAVIGTILGNALALTICVVQSVYKPISLPSDIYFMTSVPILIRPEYFLVVSAISITLCWLCSFIPARLASRMTPIKAIRFV
jgi:lipoprotein-releasing system permease protein